MSNPTRSIFATLDLGTTGIKGALWGPRGGLVLNARTPAPVVQTEDTGRAWQSWHVYAQKIVAVVQSLMRAKPANTWAALGITTQRGTVLGLDADGRPCTELISWLDGSGEADRLTAHGAPANARVSSLMSIIAESLGHSAIDTSQTCPPEAHTVHRPRPTIHPPGHLLEAHPVADGPLTGIPKGLPVILAGGDKHCEMLGVMPALDPQQAALSLGTAISLGWWVPPGEKTHAEDVPAFVTPTIFDGWQQVEVGLPGGGSAFRWLQEVLRWSPETPGACFDGPPEVDWPVCVPDFWGRFGVPGARGGWVGIGPDVPPELLAWSWMEGVLWTLERAAAAHRAEPLTDVWLCGGGASWAPWSLWGPALLGGCWHQMQGDDAGLIGVARVMRMVLETGVGGDGFAKAARRYKVMSGASSTAASWSVELLAERRGRFEAAVQALSTASGAGALRG
ncbi:MAG: FGGY family carbohydrate kinase [Bradymonadia bacterium]